MKKIFLVLFSMLLTFSVFAQKEGEQVTVEIDFGANKAAQIHQVNWVEGMTALAALQYCVNVETKPVKEYIFVTDIEGVKNIPTYKAWYYEINDQHPKLLAFRQPVDRDDKIKWIYREDICSIRRDTVYIDIRFGDDNYSNHSYKIDWKEGLTVMDALQSLVPVKTYPIDNKYIFICSVNGKNSVAQESYWTYFLNGEKAKKIAAMQLIDKGDHVVWEFRKSGQKEDKSICSE